MYSLGSVNSSFTVQSSPCAMLSPLLVQTDVIDLWLRAELAFQYPYPLRPYDLRHRIIRVLDVAYLARAKGAGLHAGGLHALRDAVVAEVGFLGRMIRGMEEPHSVRAAHNAVAAADAPRPVHHHHAVRR